MEEEDLKGGTKYTYFKYPDQIKLEEKYKFEFEKDLSISNYHKQGDLDFDRPDFLYLREELKYNSIIRDCIGQFWDILNSSLPDFNENGFISLDVYCNLMVRIYKLLRPGISNKELAKSILIDWEHDKQKLNNISKTQLNHDSFIDSLFEIVDIWTISTSFTEYLSFINNLFYRITGTILHLKDNRNIYIDISSKTDEINSDILHATPIYYCQQLELVKPEDKDSSFVTIEALLENGKFELSDFGDPNFQLQYGKYFSTPAPKNKRLAQRNPPTLPPETLGIDIINKGIINHPARDSKSSTPIPHSDLTVQNIDNKIPSKFERKNRRYNLNGATTPQLMDNPNSQNDPNLNNNTNDTQRTDLPKQKKYTLHHRDIDKIKDSMVDITQEIMNGNDDNPDHESEYEPDDELVDLTMQFSDKNKGNSKIRGKGKGKSAKKEGNPDKSKKSTKSRNQKKPEKSNNSGKHKKQNINADNLPNDVTKGLTSQSDLHSLQNLTSQINTSNDNNNLTSTVTSSTDHHKISADSTNDKSKLNSDLPNIQFKSQDNNQPHRRIIADDINIPKVTISNNDTQIDISHNMKVFNNESRPTLDNNSSLSPNTNFERHIPDNSTLISFTGSNHNSTNTDHKLKTSSTFSIDDNSNQYSFLKNDENNNLITNPNNTINSSINSNFIKNSAISGNDPHLYSNLNDLNSNTKNHLNNVDVKHHKPSDNIIDNTKNKSDTSIGFDKSNILNQDSVRNTNTDIDSSTDRNYPIYSLSSDSTNNIVTDNKSIIIDSNDANSNPFQVGESKTHTGFTRQNILNTGSSVSSNMKGDNMNKNNKIIDSRDFISTNIKTNEINNGQNIANTNGSVQLASQTQIHDLNTNKISSQDDIDGNLDGSENGNAFSTQFDNKNDPPNTIYFHKKKVTKNANKNANYENIQNKSENNVIFDDTGVNDDFPNSSSSNTRTHYISHAQSQLTSQNNMSTQDLSSEDFYNSTLFPHKSHDDMYLNTNKDQSKLISLFNSSQTFTDKIKPVLQSISSYIPPLLESGFVLKDVEELKRYGLPLTNDLFNNGDKIDKLIYNNHSIIQGPIKDKLNQQVDTYMRSKNYILSGKFVNDEYNNTIKYRTPKLPPIKGQSVEIVNLSTNSTSGHNVISPLPSVNFQKSTSNLPGTHIHAYTTSLVSMMRKSNFSKNPNDNYIQLKIVEDLHKNKIYSPQIYSSRIVSNPPLKAEIQKVSSIASLPSPMQQK